MTYICSSQALGYGENQWVRVKTWLWPHPRPLFCECPYPRGFIQPPLNEWYSLAIKSTFHAPNIRKNPYSKFLTLLLHPGKLLMLFMFRVWFPIRAGLDFWTYPLVLVSNFLFLKKSYQLDIGIGFSFLNFIPSSYWYEIFLKLSYQPGLGIMIQG